MSELNSQAINEEFESQSKIVEPKEGFVKSPREVEMELYGPNSPLPDRYRVFLFIKYRIQDNKRVSESENMTRKFIIRNTGVCETNFNRIIKSLEDDELLDVKRGNYRDSVATYSLHKGRFKHSVISPDKDKHSKPTFKVVVAVDDNGDNNKVNRNFKMKPEGKSKLQNEVVKLQNEFETPVTIAELLAISASRSLSLDPLNINLRSLEGEPEIAERVSLFSGIGKSNRGVNPNQIRDNPEAEIKRQLALLADMEKQKILA